MLTARGVRSSGVSSKAVDVLLAPEDVAPDLAAAFALPISLQQPLRVAGQIVGLVVAGDLPDDTMVLGPQLRRRWPGGRPV
jgi:hypothetical protein